MPGITVQYQCVEAAEDQYGGSAGPQLQRRAVWWERERSTKAMLQERVCSAVALAGAAEQQEGGNTEESGMYWLVPQHLSSAASGSAAALSGAVALHAGGQHKKDVSAFVGGTPPEQCRSRGQLGGT